MQKEVVERDLLNIDNFIASKTERIRRVCFDSEFRKKMVSRLCSFSRVDENLHADYALVLGTSLRFYPDKFRKRVYWASMLWHTGRVDKIVFTGRADREVGDENQGMDSKDMAVSEFGVSENVIFVSGGDNTQGNILEARPIINYGERVFLVSEAKHLIRGITVARCELGENVEVLSNPVGGPVDLNPHDPRTMIELIKAVGYNRTSYKVDSTLSDEQKLYIKSKTYESIKYYEDLLRAEINARNLSPESPFKEWYDNLPERYKIEGVKIQ